ncbi:tetratricopeptide repeat protein [Kordia sp.]|uniref:tetratricopeptide repeat protein n=1 Tax=Kordia sp. TaxID=1965332 RepID=UPI003B59DB87
MKKYTYTFILCLLISFFSYAQQHKYNALEKEAFKKALYFAYEDNPRIALHHFKQFAVSYPNSALMPKVTYNTAVLLRDLGDIEQAIPLFRKVLYTEYDYDIIDEDDHKELEKEYIVCKNKSAMHLAEIYLDKRDFKKASTYIYLFDQKHKFDHFCGNEHVAHDMYTAKMYARLYAGQQKHQKAIAELIPFMFQNPFADNDEVITLLGRLLETNYSSQELRSAAEVAVYTIKSTGSDIIIDFLNHKVKIERATIIDDLDRYKNFVKSNPLIKKYLSETQS